jgi:putative ABC transport system permease protein
VQRVYAERLRVTRDACKQLVVSSQWHHMVHLERFFSDSRYALRTLRASPGFAIAAVLTLAIGIGANTAIFSAVDGVLLEPLPFVQPDRLVSVFQDDRKKRNDHDDVAPGNFAAWRERSAAFDGLAAAEPFAVNYTGPDGEEQIYNWNVTQDFFAVLNARPEKGRLFQREDFVPNGERVVILTHASWQRRFGADPGIIGKHLTIGSVPVTIVGVLPKDFAYLASSKMEMYVPKVLDSAEVKLRNVAWWHIVGRLRPGVSVAAARADMRRVAAQLSAEYPATNAEVGANVELLKDTIVGDSSRALYLLLSAVGVVLLIACTNVANLVLARTTRRGLEFAVRTALGAPRRMLVRQVLTESLLLALAGGVTGVMIAIWGVATIRRLSPASLARIADIGINGRALGFTLTIVIIATFAFGVIPALRASRPDLSDALRAGGRASSSAARHRVRRLFVIAEVALAMVLLVGTGLLVRSFVAAVSEDRGYRTDHVLVATVFVYKWNTTPAARREFIARLVERTGAIPGVVASGATSSLPLSMAIEADKGTFTLDGKAVPAGEEPSAHMTSLTPGAFAALQIPLRRGRLFTNADDSASLPVAIISESMARQYWPGENPIGQRVKLAFYGPLGEREIVGVVADVRQVALDAPSEPTLYVPHSQAPTGGVVVVLRTSLEPSRIGRSLKRVVAELNPALPIADMQTMDDLTAVSLEPRRFALSLFLCFSAAALVLAGIGVYSVINQATVERVREFGVRTALGAQRRDILRMVMRQGFVSAGTGVAFGIAGAAALTTLMRGMLFEVVPLDALTFSVVAVLMLGTSMLACYVPAHRATGVDPLIALRAE